MRLRRGGSRRHLRGRTAFQADTEGVAAVRGRCPRLLTVQPSRLDSLACQRVAVQGSVQGFCAGGAAVRGRCPWLLTVQPSRLDSLACQRVAVQGSV